jgi:hypothetical protein
MITVAVSGSGYLFLPGLSSQTEAILLPSQLGGPFSFCASARLTPISARLSENRLETYSSSSSFLLFNCMELYAAGRNCQGKIQGKILD